MDWIQSVIRQWMVPYLRRRASDASQLGVLDCQYIK